MKFIASISSFLLVTYLAITVDAIALDEKLACGAPWNIGHSEGSSCKFWGKDDNGTHVHDGTCHKRSGFHVIHRYKCITTSVDFVYRSPLHYFVRLLYDYLEMIIHSAKIYIQISVQPSRETFDGTAIIRLSRTSLTSYASGIQAHPKVHSSNGVV
ncbi:hypothetical protein F5051DRAFT_507467 [Lentinula edodes]|nr:hypothetical protein F5051DRAFT_507467 [Lentinula edodes]